MNIRAPLQGVRLHLSGSIPEESAPAQHAGIALFVEKLASAVLRLGGTLLHGSHPSFAAPLRAAALRAVTFMSLGNGSLSASPRAVPNWADEFRKLKVVSDEVQPLQSLMELVRPLAAVGVGHGTKVNAVLSASTSQQLPCWRLAIPPSNGRRPGFGEPFAQLIESKQVELRKELVLMPVEEGSRLRADGSRVEQQDAPPLFSAYPPLALYAQMLMERLANMS